MQLVSSSCDPDGRIIRQAWDLDADGQFDDANGATANTTFSSPGARSIGLQVWSADGATDVRRRNVFVDTAYALPRPDSARLMSPFPVVTLAGRLTPAGARIRLLSVRAPICSLVRVACRGRGCPARKVQRRFAGRRSVRFRRFERRLRARAKLTVSVSRGTLIGKQTRFRIRKGRAPLRRDLCLMPGESRGSRCPRD